MYPSKTESTKDKIISVLRLRRALSLVWQSAPKWTIASAFLIVLQGILPLVSLYFMKLIVDYVTVGVNSSASKEAVLGHIFVLISLSASVALLTSLSRSASSLVSEAQTSQVSDHILDLLHAKSIDVDLEYYENPKYYDTLYRAQNDAPFRPTSIVNGLAQVAQNSISLVALFGLLASFNLIITAALAITAAPLALVRLIYSEKIYLWQRECTEKERKAWYYHWLLTSDSCAKEIRLFKLGSLFSKRYQILRKELRNERLSIISRRSVADLAVQFIGIIGIFGSLALITLSALQGNITLGDLVMIFGALQQGQSFLYSIEWICTTLRR